jgi:hypothetical protein
MGMLLSRVRLQTPHFKTGRSPPPPPPAAAPYRASGLVLCVGAAIKAHVGNVIPFAELESSADRNALTAELYARVHRLAPGAAALGPEHLEARPPHLRRRYPWDEKKPRRPLGTAGLRRRGGVAD